MIVELIVVPAMPLIRILGETPEEEITCESIVNALTGTNVTALAIEVDGKKGVSIPAKPKHGQKPQAKKAPKDKAGKP